MSIEEVTTPKSEYKNIRVKPETWQKLWILRLKFKYSSMDDVIKLLLETYEKVHGEIKSSLLF